MAFSASAVLIRDEEPTTDPEEAGLAIRSCMKCPSYRKPTDVPGSISPLGRMVPYCALKGIPLGTAKMMDSQRQKALLEAGTNCHDWGIDNSALIPETAPNPVVGVPVEFKRRPQSIIGPSNCTDCVFLKSSSTVTNELGWPMSLCMAKGELIPGKRSRSAAKGCDWGETQVSFSKRMPGTHPLPRTLKFAAWPFYGTVLADGVREKKISPPAQVKYEPHPNPIDFVGLDDVGRVLPMKPQFAEMGVRTWREVTHRTDKSREPVYLPVFDRDYFSPEEQAKIPSMGGDYRPELYIDHGNIEHAAAVNWAIGRTPILYGPAGAGKTEAANFISWRMQTPFDRISIRSDTEPASIIGKQTVRIDPRTDQAVVTWINGRLPNRWVLPGVLLLDEPNTAPDEVWHAIRPLTDSAAQLVLDENEGEKIPRNAMCFLIMASNPPWDPTYVGVREISEADGNRLGSIDVPYPPEDVERTIIVSKCHANDFQITQKQLDVIMQLTGQIRTMVDEGQCRVAWGPRVTSSLGQSLRYISLYEAVGQVVLNRIDPRERESIWTVLRGHENV